MRQFMKRTQIVGFLFVAWFARSQDLVSIIEPPLAFNMAVRVAYSQTNDFRADAVLNFPDPRGSRLLFPVIYEKCGSKISTALWFTNLTFLPEQVRNNLVSLSLNEIRAIADIETREVLCVFPGTKSYVVLPPSPKMESLFDLKSHPSKRHVVGTEILDGVRCEKVELFEEGHPSARGIAWEKDDPHRSLVRVDVQDRSGTISVMIKSFDVKPPGDWPISVPPGFKRYSNSLEIVNAAILAARTNQALSMPQMTNR